MIREKQDPRLLREVGDLKGSQFSQICGGFLYLYVTFARSLEKKVNWLLNKQTQFLQETEFVFVEIYNYSMRDGLSAPNSQFSA